MIHSGNPKGPLVLCQFDDGDLGDSRPEVEGWQPAIKHPRLTILPGGWLGGRAEHQFSVKTAITPVKWALSDKLGRLPRMDIFEIQPNPRCWLPYQIGRCGRYDSYQRYELPSFGLRIGWSGPGPRNCFPQNSWALTLDGFQDGKIRNPTR